MAFKLKDPADAQRYNQAANIWVARIIPVLLAVVVGYATYVTVVVLSVHYLLVQSHEKHAAIAILVVYFVSFLLMAASFFRLVHITVFDPPVVPLGPDAIRSRKNKQKGKEGLAEKAGIGGAEYDTGNTSGDTTRSTIEPKDDPDSPGLELFYTKDVFVCELDGKPRWCHHCANWKPDRAHHDSSSGRCVQKMDHFCPWVGGPVGENNMKFFIQFTGYTSLYCLHLLVVMAFYVARQKSTQGEHVSGNMGTILGIAAFFLLFTAGMSSSSIQLAMKNRTQVEELGTKTRLHTLAIIKPPQEVLLSINSELATQPPYGQITYPLRVGIPPPSEHAQGLAFPSIKINGYAEQQRPSPLAPNLESTEVSSGSVSGPAIDPTTLPQTETANFPVVPSVELPSAGQSGTAIGPVHTDVTPIPDSQLSKANGTAGQHLTDRDLRASRTFAILSMQEVGQNPWDLGSPFLNLKTVMGSNLIDWFLPIKRSPCCNHEGSESAFELGPAVDSVRQHAGFITGMEIEHSGGVTRTRRRMRSRRQGSGAEAETPQMSTATFVTNVEMDQLEIGTGQTLPR